MAVAERARVSHGLPHSMEYVLRRGVEDHRFFCNFWYDWDPHPAQLLWGAHRAKRGFLITGARSGKSEGEAARRGKRMFYRPGTFHGNGSITLQQARIVHDKLLMLGQRGRFAPMIHDVRESPFPEITLVNKARHTCRSTQLNAKYLRGEKFHEFNLDEGSYERKAVWDEVLSLRVADTDGLLTVTTTPKGKNWLFYEAGRARAIMQSQMMRGVPIIQLESFFRHGPSYENPYIPARVWKRLRRLPARSWAQEVEGYFVELENAMFTDAEVTNFTNADLNLPPEKGGAETSPDAGHIYVMGIDLARHRHKSVIVLMRVDCRPWRVLKIVTMYQVRWEKQIDVILTMMRKWRAHVRFDSNGIGDPVGELAGLNPKRYGIVGQGVTADQVLVRLQHAGTSRPPLFELPFDADMDFDLRHYTWDAKEESNEDGDVIHWDHLKALAYAVHEAFRVNPGLAQVTTGGKRASAAIHRSERSALAMLENYEGTR